MTGFEHARNWLADVRAHADPHLTCILVGNKSDLANERRQVSAEEGARWAEEEGILFVEASAKSGANVEAAFEAAARDILSKIRRGVFDDERVRCVLVLASYFVSSQLAVPGSQIVQTCGWRRARSEQPDWWGMLHVRASQI